MKPLMTFLALVALTATIQAQTVVIPTTSYGWLNQYSLDNSVYHFVGNEACVPTSSTNALTYLQNTFPEIYGTTLTGGTTYQNWINTDATLIGLMGTTPVNGTYYNQFVYALRDYIFDLGFTNTTFSGMFPSDNWDTQYPKPDFVTNGRPTAAFLLSSLSAGNAVLTSIEYNNGGGHELLVNGISWDSLTNTGTLYFIDPLDSSQAYDGSTVLGPAKQTTGNLTLDTEGFLRMEYLQYSGSLPYSPGDYSNVSVGFFGALAVVPEPSVLLLLLPGLMVIAWIRRRAA